MIKYVCLVILLVTFFSSAACDSNSANTNKDKNITTETLNQNSDIYGSINGDWPVYQNANELVESADLVFTGKVTGISFQMLDMRDIETIGDDETGDRYYDLYTLYDVDILTPYKRELMQSIQVRMMGGLMDYHVEEQLKILAQYNKQYVPVLEERLEYKIGETHLFVLHQYMDITPTPLNLTQGSYNLHNPFEKHTVGMYDLDDSYYSKTVDALGNPIISAKDVILTFGQDKWESFWAQWQKENPDWETWLNRDTVGNP
jgi:hypothetical protein